MRQKPLYVNELFDAATPRPTGERLQNFQEQPSKAVAKIARRLIGASLVVSFLMAAALVVMIVFYFQRETYLKEVNKEAKRLADSLRSEELQKNASLFDEMQPASSGKVVPNMLHQPQGQSIEGTNSPSSNRDAAGFQILRNLKFIEAALQSLQEKAKTCSTSRCRDSKCTNRSLDGWRQNGAYLYFFSTDIKNWTDAETFCISHNSHLASIRTTEEWLYLKSAKGNDNFWIGLTAREGTCSFVDGSVCGNPTFWAEFQSDNRVLDNGEKEQCVEMQASGLWNDIACSASLKWICKKSVCNE